MKLTNPELYLLEHLYFGEGHIKMTYGSKSKAVFHSADGSQTFTVPLARVDKLRDLKLLSYRGSVMVLSKMAEQLISLTSNVG